jgi:hypothetical protein
VSKTNRPAAFSAANPHLSGDAPVSIRPDSHGCVGGAPVDMDLMSDDDIREASDTAFLREEVDAFVGNYSVEDIDAALADPKRSALIGWLAGAFVEAEHDDASAFAEARSLAAAFAAEVRGSDILRSRREAEHEDGEVNRDRDGDSTEFLDVDVDTIRAPGIGFTSSDFGGKAA